MSGVSGHYTVGDLGDRILAALRTQGVDVEALAVDDLAPVDAFHIRGRAATEELADLAQIRGGRHVLDVGCGIGGTIRYLADRFHCVGTGVDLTEEYCSVATMLSQRVGLAESTHFRQASAMDLPFGNGVFDVVWTEHVQMNIVDKAGFYGELTRVMKPGGQLVFHDIFAGRQGGLHLPVPWAAEASISHLADPDEVRAMLAGLGLTATHWEDKTEASAAFFRQVVDRIDNEGWMPLGLHLLMGDTAAVRFRNVLHNLDDQRIRVVQAVLRHGG
jgi:SAM-dependent methyltransferase